MVNIQDVYLMMRYVDIRLVGSGWLQVFKNKFLIALEDDGDDFLLNGLQTFTFTYAILAALWSDLLVYKTCVRTPLRRILLAFSEL